MLEQNLSGSHVERSISVREIMRILKSRMLIIAVSAILGLFAAGVVTFFVLTPKYSSSVQLIVKLPKSDSTKPNVNDVNFTLQMITTYKGIIKSNFVLDEVEHRLNEEKKYQSTANELRGQMDVSQEQNSQIFSVSVTSLDPYQAQTIANTTAEVFKDKLTEVQDIENVEILSPAKVSHYQVSPNKKLNLMMGLVVGILAGVCLAFLVELLDRTVKSESFVVDTLRFTNLGTVNRMTEKELNARITNRIDQGPQSQQIG